MLRLRSVWITAAFMSLAAIGCGAQQHDAPSDDSVRAALDSVLTKAMERGDVPGVVALVTNRDSVIYLQAVGHLDENRQEPMQPDAIFRIMSMTKPVTSVAIMMLAEEGRVDLNAPASRYLPELEDREVVDELTAESFTTRLADREVTVHHLMTHTAGFAYRFWSREWMQLSALTQEEDDTALPLLHDPGERFTYGLSTRLLGRIVEAVTDQPLDSVLEARVLVPLSMADTGYRLAPQDEHRFVALHQRTSGELQADPRPDEYVPSIEGDGGFLSTADDYGRFVRMILRGGSADSLRLLSEESIERMATNQIGHLVIEQHPVADSSQVRPFPIDGNVDKFGLGFQITMQDQPRRRSAGSLSWSGMHNTHFWIDREQGIAAVLLMQVLPWYDEACIRLLRDFEEALYEHARPR